MPHMKARATYHHGDLKEALIAAGESVLRDSGLQGFTLRECARRAGVSHAAPKHHFADVRGLLSQIAARGHTRLTRRLRAKLRSAGDDLDEQFLATLEAYVGFAQVFPEHFRIMFRLDLIDPEVPELVTAAQETFTELTNVIRRQRGEAEITVPMLGGTMTSADLIDDILIGWCQVHGFAHLRLEGQLPWVTRSAQRDVLRKQSRRLARLIRAGTGSAGAGSE
jgi:AcrR family transcriptional regulator